MRTQHACHPRWLFGGILAVFAVFSSSGCAGDKQLPRIDVDDGRCTRRAGTVQTHEPCTLSLLSYNVHGISSLIFHDVGPGDTRFRSASLGFLARDYDLVLLQEDFEYHDRIIEGPKVAYVQRGSGPRWTMLPLRVLTLPLFWVPLNAPYGSGLTIAAPALRPVEVKRNGKVKRTDGVLVRKGFADCHGWFRNSADCFSTKGLLGVRLSLRNGAEVDIYTTHLDAGDSKGDQKARRAQLASLRRRSGGSPGGGR